MSFSSDVKIELCDTLPDAACCRTAQAYGMLLFGHAFSADEISLQTEQPAVADTYSRMLTEVCGIGAPRAEMLRRRTVLHLRRVDDPAERGQVLQVFGHSPQDSFIRLNRANLDCDHCARAMLRGAFLSCGAVTDPRHDYHLEFGVSYYNLSRDLSALLREIGFPAKTVRRGGSYVVYLKESEAIEDCLTYLGAPHATLELMNVKMIKSIRNDTNRRFNCENANIDKTVAAAAVQTDALHRIEQSGGLDSLPEELRALARLRLDNPDMSLRELGEALEPPLTRSGVNHRLQRLMAIAEEIGK